MTQATISTDLTVAALQESVRHNEKNIDKLDRDIKDFRAEVLKQFEKVDQRFEKGDQRREKIKDRFNQQNMLLLARVGLIVTVIVKLFVFDDRDTGSDRF